MQPKNNRLPLPQRHPSECLSVCDYSACMSVSLSLHQSIVCPPARMYVSMYVCTYTCMYKCMCVRIALCTRVFLSVGTFMRMPMSFLSSYVSVPVSEHASADGLLCVSFSSCIERYQGFCCHRQDDDFKNKGQLSQFSHTHALDSC